MRHTHIGISHAVTRNSLAFNKFEDQLRSAKCDNILHDADTHSGCSLLRYYEIPDTRYKIELGLARSDPGAKRDRERALTGDAAISMRRKQKPKRLFMVYLPRRFVRFAPDSIRFESIRFVFVFVFALYAKRGTSSICLCKSRIERRESSCSCNCSGNNQRIS